jgi:hypothetical protein
MPTKVQIILKFLISHIFYFLELYFGYIDTNKNIIDKFARFHNKSFMSFKKNSIEHNRIYIQ